MLIWAVFEIIRCIKLAFDTCEVLPCCKEVIKMPIYRGHLCLIYTTLAYPRYYIKISSAKSHIKIVFSKLYTRSVSDFIFILIILILSLTLCLTIFNFCMCIKTVFFFNPCFEIQTSDWDPQVYQLLPSNFSSFFFPLSFFLSPPSDRRIDNSWYIWWCCLSSSSILGWGNIVYLLGVFKTAYSYSCNSGKC